MTGLVVRWACVMVGLIYFTTESAFFAPVRVRLARSSDFLRMLLYCPACSGFWLGLLISSQWPDRGPAYVLMSGIAGMGVGAMWATFHDNVAWIAEARARGEVEVDDDETEASEDGG